MERAFAVLVQVMGDDGQPIVEARGVEPRLTEARRDLVNRIDEEMVIWGRTYRRTYGTKAALMPLVADDEEPEDTDPYAHADEDDWDHTDAPTNAEAVD
jgi:hypothetical protein